MTSAVGVRVRPAMLLQASLLISLTANLGRIPVFSVGVTNAPILVSDMAVGMVLIGGVIAAAQARSLRLDNVALLALAFATVGFLSTLFAVQRLGLSGFETGVSLAYLVRWLFYFGLYVVAINGLTRSDVGAVWGALEWMLLLFAAFGIVQSIFLPGFAQMVYADSRSLAYDWDIQGHRLVSTVLEPNIASAMMMLGLLVQLGQLSAGAAVPRWKPLLLFTAMVFTLSRSGALGLFFGGLVILAVRGVSARTLKLGAVVAVAVLVALPKLIPFAQQYDKLRFGGSATGRLVNLGLGLSAFLDSPWIGVGFNTYGFHMERRGIERLGLSAQSQDGGLLFTAVMTGVIGLAVFLWMLRAVIRRCRAVWRDPARSARDRGLCIGVAAGIVALCVSSVFVNGLYATPVLQPLWVLFALTYAVTRPDDAVSSSPSSEHVRGWVHA